MKKQEMIETLKTQGATLNKEIAELQEQFNYKKDQLIRIEGALEALDLLDDEPIKEPEVQQEVPDHTEAAKVLGI